MCQQHMTSRHWYLCQCSRCQLHMVCIGQILRRKSRCLLGRGCKQPQPLRRCSTLPHRMTHSLWCRCQCSRCQRHMVGIGQILRQKSRCLLGRGCRQTQPQPLCQWSTLPHSMTHSLWCRCQCSRCLLYMECTWQPPLHWSSYLHHTNCTKQ